MVALQEETRTSGQKDPLQKCHRLQQGATICPCAQTCKVALFIVQVGFRPWSAHPEKKNQVFKKEEFRKKNAAVLLHMCENVSFSEKREKGK